MFPGLLPYCPLAGIHPFREDEKDERGMRCGESLVFSAPNAGALSPPRYGM
jgi:hypothetical protein